MRQYTCLLVLAMIVASCGGNRKQEAKTAPPAADTAQVTDYEKKAIKEITDFYGGMCHFSTGMSKDGRKKFARLDMSNSTQLDSFANITELNLSNIAFIFYKDLAENKSTFDEIQVSIAFGNGQRIEKTFPLSTLQLVSDKAIIVSEIVDLIKSQHYNGLDTLLNDQSGIINYKKDFLIRRIKESDPPLGMITAFVPYGFMFIKANNGKDILHISGVMLRENNKTEFSVDIDPASTKREALFINYKL